MTPKKQYYEAKANTIITNLNKRHIDGYYCATKEEAVSKALSFLHEGATISWGGSMSLEEVGLIKALQNGNYNLLDRSTARNPIEVEKIYRESFFSDFYFMSTNAITMNGILYNVDGTGNRVAAMIYGPKEVIIIAGMNKVCLDEDEAQKRVRNVAAPINTQRLNKNTPCTKIGKCTECLVDDCICMHTVITRNSKPKDRIKVILVGEELGY